ncbi:MAG: transposase [Bacteroidales bacterium]|jgi:REP element-mobilizing transposase RayT|nr:transposase [Bacteroidales bacterium]
MSTKYKFFNPDGAYFVTFSVKDWVDVFIRNAYKNILVESLAYCLKNKGLEVFAWCIMSSHVHMIIRAKDGFLLQNILRNFKTYTSKMILKAIDENPQESRKEWLLPMFDIANPNHQFWQSGSHPIEVWSNKVIYQKLDYIHQNPVEEGIVFSPEQYVYSSAIDYADGKGLLDVIIIR